MFVMGPFLISSREYDFSLRQLLRKIALPKECLVLDCSLSINIPLLRSAMRFKEQSPKHQRCEKPLLA